MDYEEQAAANTKHPGTDIVRSGSLPLTLILIYTGYLKDLDPGAGPGWWGIDFPFG